MIALSVKLTDGQISTTFGALSGDKRREAIGAACQFLVSKAKDNILARTGPRGAWPSGPWTEGFAGPRIWADISQSLQWEVIDDNTGSVSATHVAAGVRQMGTIGAGGTLPDIHPVKKKALTIPIDPASQRASYNGIDARTAFPDAFMLKEKHGASPLFVGVLARYTGGRMNKKTGKKENQKLQLLYLLVSSVAIRPHPFLPIDSNGAIAPESVWTEISDLITTTYLQN